MRKQIADKHAHTHNDSWTDREIEEMLGLGLGKMRDKDCGG